jgi:hypothetical protein
MKKTLTIYFFILATSCLCKGQTNNIEGCYIWSSNYYVGDFQKICFYPDSTFYYQRHQNDVLPDTYSKGIWQSNSDTIKLKSIEPFISDTQIIQSGNPLKDSIFIKVVDIQTGESLQYRTFDIFDLNMNKISSHLTDSLGVLNIKFKSEFKYLRCRQFMDYNPILLNSNALTNDHIIIKMKIDNYALIFKDITDIKLFSKTKNNLVEEYEPKKFINYYRQK